MLGKVMTRVTVMKAIQRKTQRRRLCTDSEEALKNAPSSAIPVRLFLAAKIRVSKVYFSDLFSEIFPESSVMCSLIQVLGEVGIYFQARLKLWCEVGFKYLFQP
jgi:hypothetical protein